MVISVLSCEFCRRRKMLHPKHGSLIYLVSHTATTLLALREYPTSKASHTKKLQRYNQLFLVLVFCIKMWGCYGSSKQAFVFLPPLLSFYIAFGKESAGSKKYEGELGYHFIIFVALQLMITIIKNFLLRCFWKRYYVAPA